MGWTIVKLISWKSYSQLFLRNTNGGIKLWKRTCNLTTIWISRRKGWNENLSPKIWLPKFRFMYSTFHAISNFQPNDKLVVDIWMDGILAKMQGWKKRILVESREYRKKWTRTFVCSYFISSKFWLNNWFPNSENVF